MLILDECSFGRVYHINSFKEGCLIRVRRRLCDLGFVPGTSITIVRKSFLRKVLLVELRGYTLSLQRDIAKWVVVNE